MEWKQFFQPNLIKIIITFILSLPVIIISMGVKLLGFQSWCMLFPEMGIGGEPKLSIGCVIITLIATILIVYFIVSIFQMFLKRK